MRPAGPEQQAEADWQQLISFLGQQRTAQPLTSQRSSPWQVAAGHAAPASQLHLHLQPNMQPNASPTCAVSVYERSLQSPVTELSPGRYHLPELPGSGPRQLSLLHRLARNANAEVQRQQASPAASASTSQQSLQLQDSLSLAAAPRPVQSASTALQASSARPQAATKNLGVSYIEQHNALKAGMPALLPPGFSPAQPQQRSAWPAEQQNSPAHQQLHSKQPAAAPWAAHARYLADMDLDDPYADSPRPQKPQQKPAVQIPGRHVAQHTGSSSSELAQTGAAQHMQQLFALPQLLPGKAAAAAAAPAKARFQPWLLPHIMRTPAWEYLSSCSSQEWDDFTSSTFHSLASFTCGDKLGEGTYGEVCPASLGCAGKRAQLCLVVLNVGLRQATYASAGSTSAVAYSHAMCSLCNMPLAHEKVPRTQHLANLKKPAHKEAVAF